MKRTPALILVIFLGEFGIHRFLAGKIGTGILWFCTCGLFGFGWLYDIIMVATGKFMTKSSETWVSE